MAELLINDIEILRDFIIESKESIDMIEPILLETDSAILNEEEINSESLNAIFRIFHSMKGSAGFIGLTMINRVTHHAETILDHIRKDKLKISTSHVDILLELLDFFKSVVGQLGETMSEEPFNAQGEAYIERLDKIIAENNLQSKPRKKTKTKTTKVTKSVQKTYIFDELKPLDGSKTTERKLFSEGSHTGIQSIKNLLNDAKSGITKDILEELQKQLSDLRNLTCDAGEPDACKLMHHLLIAVNQFLDTDEFCSDDELSIIANTVEEMEGGLENYESKGSVLIPSTYMLLDIINEFLEVGIVEEISIRDNNVEQSTPDLSETIEVSDPLSAVVEDTVQKPELGSDGIIVPDLPKTPSPAPEAKTAAPPTGGGAAGPKAKKSAAGAHEVIRVDVVKLNALMDLVGEIVIAESMVSQHPDIRNIELPDFEKSLDQLHKNIRELQDIATGMRMVPLAGTFKKMVRLIRDLSGKTGKKVKLDITGGDTEVDRSVIENISDPLVHLIRNSVDHGLESGEERIAAGKNEEGVVYLDGNQVGPEIHITVEDDGRGLNRGKILDKAISKGIVTDNPDELTDEEVYRLIFAAGLSTKEKVSDVSGRGVGMDVVVRNIEAIRGKVDVESREGTGTSIVLRIPLTTAIIDGILVRVKETIFAIPILDIKESFKIENNLLTEMMDGQEVIKVRDELIPLIRLHNYFEIDRRQLTLDTGLIVIAENDGKRVCLFVDELIDQRSLVVKSLSTYLGEIEGLSGCAILGTGEICLILDIAKLNKST